MAHCWNPFSAFINSAKSQEYHLQIIRLSGEANIARLCETEVPYITLLYKLLSPTSI